jgi:hypothetical protein
MVSRNVFADVVGAVLQQDVAEDGKRGLQDAGAVVSVKLLRDDWGRHFESEKQMRES